MLPFTLRLALYILVGDGVAALHLAEFLGLRSLLLVLVLLAAIWAAGARGWRVEPRSLAARAVVVIAAIAAVFDLLYVAETVLDALVRLLLFLVFYKLVALRSVPETRTVSFLAFFMLVAASASAVGVGFLFVFVAFVGLATWLTLLQHVLTEAQPGPGRIVVGADARPVGPRPLLGLALAATGGIFLITGALFVVLPRVGLAALPLRARMGQMVTGFSDRVELGAYGSILTNEAIAMRVRLLDEEADPARLPNLHWRGNVLDEFDGRAWSVRHPRRTRVVRPSAGGFDVGVLQHSGRVLRQEIFLEPIGSEVIFAAPHALRFTLPVPMIAVDDMESVTVPPPQARLVYTVESELETSPPAAGGAPPSRPLAPRLERYLQLPPLPERIPALARQVAGGSADPSEVAGRLVDFLTHEFRYTLDIERVTSLEPLDEFLFVRRSGHCEYFAAALAVMLRSLGIPARVVGGFLRGEWNPHGRYFIVRMKDAHAWVEAYLADGSDGTGWVTLDPSPRAWAEPPRTPAPIMLYLDALRLQWSRYVINWSLRDQIRVGAALRLRGAEWSPWLASTAARGRGRAGVAALVLLGLGVASLCWWRSGRFGLARSTSQLPAFYGRALRTVARRGLRPREAETAREFSVRVGGLGLAAAETFARLTAAYERCRFGGARLSDAERRDLAASLAALATATAAATVDPRADAARASA